MTGKERLERLYRRLKKNFPDKDIRFEDQSLSYGTETRIKYKVSYWRLLLSGEKRLVCDAIWGNGTFGYDLNLLEVWGIGCCEPEGYVTELRAYNFFKKHIVG